MVRRNAVASTISGKLVHLEMLGTPREQLFVILGGLITATRGNHGQSIPFAAARYGVPVTVAVPECNSREKNRAMEGWGARLLVHGRDFDTARKWLDIFRILPTQRPADPVL